jgi:hypothetical protein
MSVGRWSDAEDNDVDENDADEAGDESAEGDDEGNDDFGLRRRRFVFQKTHFNGCPPTLSLPASSACSFKVYFL